MRALITGGGRGIGAEIAGALAADGWEVVVGARSAEQVQAVAETIGGRAVTFDVTDADSVAQAMDGVGEVDLLVANAAATEGHHPPPSWEIDPVDWWHIYAVNVLGVHLSCRAVIPGMLARGAGRIVVTGSGAAFLPNIAMTAYAPSKGGACRYAETLAVELAGRIPVFCFDPGLVRTQLTSDLDPDAPFTSPANAARLVTRLAGGDYDALAGRFLHAADDDLDDLLARVEEVRADDLLAIRLRR